MPAPFLRRLPAAAVLAVVLAAPAHAQPVVRLPAADRALAGRPTQLFAVGRAEGRDWETFARVAQVAFDPAGNLYVLDQGRGRVVVLDRQGGFVRQFGRPGRGPGEFIAPMQLAVAPDGAVVVADLGRRAYAVFGPDGTYRTSVPFATRTGVAGLSLQAFPGGGVITVVQQLAGAGGPDAPQSASRSLLWQPLDGSQPPATLFTSTDRVGAPGEGEAAGGGRVAVSSTVMFAPRLHFGVFPNGALAVAHTAEYRIQVTGTGRSAPTARILERPLPPRRVTAADRERARETERARLREGAVVISPHGGGAGHGLPVGLLERQVEGMQFADVIPAIAGMAVDRAGRLWVQRPGARADEPGPIDLLTQQGAYLGTLTGVALPAAFADGRAAWIETDGEGVQRVVVRALPAWR